MNQTTKPLTLKHRIGYALGDFGGCMTFSLMSSFMTRYYVNVALMDTAVIAAMTLIWKIFDALSNPVIGVMMDKSFAKGNGKGGKFRPCPGNIILRSCSGCRNCRCNGRSRGSAYTTRHGFRPRPVSNRWRSSD